MFCLFLSIWVLIFKGLSERETINGQTERGVGGGMQQAAARGFELDKTRHFAEML